MAKRHFHAPTLGMALISSGLAGCGSSDETARYRLVPVSGTITLNGKMAEGIQVTFNPEGTNAPATPGVDTTGPEGNYKMMYRDRSGLAPGKYKILLNKTIFPGGAAPSGDEDPDMARAAARARALTSSKKGNEEEVPMQIQGSFDKEVPSSGGVIDLDLKGKPTPISPK